MYGYRFDSCKKCPGAKLSRKCEMVLRLSQKLRRERTIILAMVSDTNKGGARGLKLRWVDSSIYL